MADEPDVGRALPRDSNISRQTFVVVENLVLGHAVSSRGINHECPSRLRIGVKPTDKSLPFGLHNQIAPQPRFHQRADLACCVPQSQRIPKRKTRRPARSEEIRMATRQMPEAGVLVHMRDPAA